MKQKKESPKIRIRSASKMLVHYKKQLLARHKQEPFKSPPVFLLDLVISMLQTTVKEL